MTVCSTCISWNEGKAHLSSRLTHRSNKVHVLCTTQASWLYSCNNIGLEVHTCHLPHSYRLLLEVQRASSHMLLSQFSHNFKKSADLLQPEEALNSHSLLQGLFLITYEPCGSLQLTNADYSVKVTLLLIWPFPLPSMQNVLPFT